MIKSIRTLTLITAIAALLASCGVSDSKTYTLRIGAGHPAGPAVYATQLRDYFVPEVERRVAEETDFKVQFIEGYGGSIASTAETLEAVQSGILDIGGYCVCFEPSKLFLHNFMYFTPFGPQDSVASVKTARRVYDANPWLEEQLNHDYRQRLLALNGWDNYHLGTVNPWTTIEDLRGVKIGGAGPNLPWLEYAGVTPVQSSLPDGYLSLETGVYDGWLMFPSAYYSFKFHEPAPHYTLIGFGAMGGAVIVTMNNKRFNKLPPEVQTIIMEVAKDYELKAAQTLDQRQVGGLEDLRGSGATVTELAAESRAIWARSLAEFPNAMAQEANSRGMPGTDVMSAYIQEVTQSGHPWPTEYEIK
ncbi:MAG: C4-dicarboxylate TRAP transporter substrate-binding protein [Hyphomonadaceae bacterium]